MKSFSRTAWHLIPSYWRALAIILSLNLITHNCAVKKTMVKTSVQPNVEESYDDTDIWHEYRAHSTLHPYATILNQQKRSLALSRQFLLHKFQYIYPCAILVRDGRGIVEFFLSYNCQWRGFQMGKIYQWKMVFLLLFYRWSCQTCGSFLESLSSIEHSLIPTLNHKAKRRFSKGMTQCWWRKLDCSRLSVTCGLSYVDTLAISRWTLTDTPSAYARPFSLSLSRSVSALATMN